ncbi:MAG: magnesium transporter [Acidobacteria bacterium]|nr:MAG: magnesium transporter [Acidobacteriota bacterium]PIE88914.1 MAG: magnesium transporter [Acidobacteriota bacterium]
MLGNKSRLLLQSIKTFVARSSDQKLVKVLDKIHPADLALILGHLKRSEVDKVFSLIKDNLEFTAEVLKEAQPDVSVEILENLSPKVISLLLQEMYSDDAAQILDRFPDELREAVLKEMEDIEQQEVEERLDYQEETAGRIMVPDFFALHPETTVKEAIKALQKNKDVEIFYYIYVVSDEGRLVGVASLRQLLLVSPDTLIRDIMEPEVITINTDADQEDVARKVARYNLIAIPVVDDVGRMQGIVTVDDVIDIIKEEATEDMLKMAGAHGDVDSVQSGSILANVKIRWPWLLASWFGGMFAFYITGQFESALEKVVILAGFIPIVMGMGGNIGTQSSILVVRGLATRLIDPHDLWSVISRELRVALSLGILYGALLTLAVFLLLKTGIIAQSEVHETKLALVIGLGVFSSMMVAAVIGTLCPIILDRIHIDPAIATGPLVTTSIDVFGILVYFTIASWLLL